MIPLLKGQFFLAVHLVGAGGDVGTRPDTALGPARMMVDAENGCVEIGQGVKVNQAGADKRVAEIYAAGDFTLEPVSDEEDFTVLENHFAVAKQGVAAILVTDDPACCQKGAAFRPVPQWQGLQRIGHQGASTKATPWRAVIRPPLTTSGRGATLTTAWASVSPTSSVKSALQPTSMP